MHKRASGCGWAESSRIADNVCSRLPARYRSRKNLNPVKNRLDVHYEKYTAVVVLFGITCTSYIAVTETWQMGVVSSGDEAAVYATLWCIESGRDSRMPIAPRNTHTQEAFSLISRLRRYRVCHTLWSITREWTGFSGACTVRLPIAPRNTDTTSRLSARYRD